MSKGIFREYCQIYLCIILSSQLVETFYLSWRISSSSGVEQYSFLSLAQLPALLLYELSPSMRMETCGTQQTYLLVMFYDKPRNLHFKLAPQTISKDIKDIFLKVILTWLRVIITWNRIYLRPFQFTLMEGKRVGDWIINFILWI